MARDDLVKTLLDTISKNIELIHKEDKRAHEDISMSFNAINQRMNSIDATNIKQNANLEEHMRRTEIAEKNIKDNANRLVPLERHVAMWAGAGKVLVIFGVIASIGGALVKILFMK